jgi:hypothetical protein
MGMPHLSADGHFGGLDFLAIIGNFVMNFFAQVIVYDTCFQFSFMYT